MLDRSTAKDEVMDINLEESESEELFAIDYDEGLPEGDRVVKTFKF